MGLAREIHREFPRLPLPWYRIILLDDGQRYLLALKDNRTLVHANAKLEPEDVDGVRAKLELGPQKPKWYPLPE
ncbi:hypothetical protein DENSPDRAFT_834903 [Dentipellis sp. KUC8613]|nr:hypothetical protein DENSPDRAFT_834903 [Dentipellis sp. KUC8613]